MSSFAVGDKVYIKTGSKLVATVRSWGGVVNEEFAKELEKLPADKFIPVVVSHVYSYSNYGMIDVVSQKLLDVCNVDVNGYSNLNDQFAFGSLVTQHKPQGLSVDVDMLFTDKPSEQDLLYV